ncbi:MAG: amino acid permease, partial [Thermomicrobiales bacterium]|nr:amino acid permease [Thermomicrobiales bacterium]
SYAYARAAFGPLIGFLAGWALYVGEWVSLPVFPLAFVNYLGIFAPDLSRLERLAIMAALIVAVTAVNAFGARSGGRVNDVLTVAKLVPLALLAVAGLLYTALRPGATLAHVTPFAPLGFAGFGAAVVPIFWAYAGFELAVVPSGEVRQPRRTLPRGLIAGVSIATLVYLSVAWGVASALPWQTTAVSTRPLADALAAIAAAFGLAPDWGRVVMGLGALLSIAGVYEVFTLSLARLSYALAADGLFPRSFAWLHPTYRTPWVGFAVQAISAFVLVQFGELRGPIEASVFFLGLCYVLTGLAALRLVAQSPDRALHVPALRALLVLGAASGAYLALQVPPRLLALGAAAIALGLMWYGWLRWRRPPAAAEPAARTAPGGAERLRRHHGDWLWRSLRQRPGSDPAPTDLPSER